MRERGESGNLTQGTIIQSTRVDRREEQNDLEDSLAVLWSKPRRTTGTNVTKVQATGLESFPVTQITHVAVSLQRQSEPYL